MNRKKKDDGKKHVSLFSKCSRNILEELQLFKNATVKILGTQLFFVACKLLLDLVPGMESLKSEI